MSHDHLELTALHPWHRWVPQVSSGLLSLTTILALVALWNGFSTPSHEHVEQVLRQQAFSRGLVTLLVASGTLGLGTWWASARWRPRTILLSARQLVWDGLAVPLHEVLSIEVTTNRPRAVLVDGGQLDLPPGYGLTPSEADALVTAARRVLAGIAAAEDRPQARQALETLARR